MGGPVEIDLPYIHAYTDRHGRVRHYFRRKGYPKITLPPPENDEFLTAYREALARCTASPEKPKPTVAIVPGTFKALCFDFINSADFRQLAASTRRELKYVLDALEKEHGDKRVARLERKHILAWKDKLAGKPGAANKMLRTIKWILGFAVDRDYRTDNPAAKIKMMKLGRYRAWSDEELTAFEQYWRLGTLERTGFALAYYTAQRRGDLVKLKWSSIAGGSLHLTQNKTGTPMELRVHRELRKALAAVHPRHEAAILTGAQGRPLNDVYFGHRMARAIELAGLPDDCVLHGLRKTAARVLAEIGAQITPVTGHLTERMAAEYSRDADQTKQAKASVLKWEGSKRRTNRGGG